MQVLLVGAPTVTVQKYQKIVEMSGLSVAGVETEMLASVRAIVSSSTFPISLIVNIGNLNSSIAIIQQGVIVFAYTVPIGSISITRAIASDFGFTPEQADEYKKAYGISDPNVGAKIKRTVEPILASLASEIKKALAFYVQRYQGDMPVTQMVLSGGTAKLPGIDSFFVNAVGLETVVANPWTSLRIENVPQSFADEGPEFTVAIGLALKRNEH
jgi:type IV pilus assembly protein PilM